MRFRFHRGTLEESLATTVEVGSMEELRDHLVKHGYPESKIDFDYMTFDKRCGWDTFYVCIRPHGQAESLVIGMSDGKFEDNSKGTEMTDEEFKIQCLRNHFGILTTLDFILMSYRENVLSRLHRDTIAKLIEETKKLLPIPE